MDRFQNVKDMHVLRAGPQSSLYAHSHVFNLQLMGPEIYVKLDPKVHKLYRLMKIYDADTYECVSEYVYDPLEHPWIDIPTSCLNLRAGLHVYIVEFINTVTGDTFYQYFEYTIQDDDPYKPYIYMSRSN